MKTIIFIILAITFYNTPAFSSGGSPPPPPLFKAKNITSVYLAPLITGDTKPTLFARITYAGVSDLDGRIDLQGTTTDQNGIVDGKNFEWNTPTVKLNLGTQARLSESLSLITNIDVNIGQGLDLGGFDVAFNAVMLNENENTLRFGIGINIHPTDFKWFTSPNNYRNEKKVDYDPVLSVTYNTDHQDWIINPFAQFTYTTQTLVDVQDESFVGEVYKNVTVFTLTPGFKYNISEKVFLNIGLSFSRVNNIENSKEFAFMPFAQINSYF